MIKLKKHRTAVLALLLLLAAVGCKNDSGVDDTSARIAELKAENHKLQSKLDECQSQKGFFAITAGGAVLGAAVLLCVGMAIGMKINRKVTEDEA